VHPNKLLDVVSSVTISYERMDSKTYTTAEAAAKIGVTRQTLYTWINRGLIAAPRLIKTGKSSNRLWTKSDVESARKFKGTLKTGRKKKQAK
jgi:excisionase family DNA binding protein